MGIFNNDELYTVSRPYEYVEVSPNHRRVPRPISEADLDYLRKFFFVSILCLIIPLAIKFILRNPERAVHEAISGTSIT